MRILPAQAYSIQSNAEIKVFRRLKDSSSLGQGAVAFHSLNIPNHLNQRFGEADFVILCSRGLFVLEIKGGRISRDEKAWNFIDRNGNSNKSQRSPFKQAEEALHSIEKSIRAKLGTDLAKNLVIGYGVVTPDCNLPETEEWNPKTILNADNFGLFDKWLFLLVKYWNEKTPWGVELGKDKLDRISRYLRPCFETSIPLHTILENAENSICELTEEQFKFLDIIEVNERTICSGGAGTGKTFLAVELCRRFSQDKSVLLICRSRILARYMDTLLQMQHVVVTTIDALSVNAKRKNIEMFDILIVDEGQDLCNYDDLEQIEKYLKNGWGGGNWFFFHDVNNQSGLVGKYDKDAMEYLKSFNPAYIPLRKNCRNTEPIMKAIQEFTHYDMGNSGTGIGPAVKTVHCSLENQAEILSQELEHLHSENVLNKDITILSSKSFNESCVNSLSSQFKKNIQVINDYNIAAPDPNKIMFSEICAFKGLENRCIILIDIDRNIENYLSACYVGMSRARAMLIMLKHESP